MSGNDDAAGEDRPDTTDDGTAFGREVMGAYDEVGGHDAFVIAALDRPDAWIAVPAGAELEVEDWE